MINSDVLSFGLVYFAYSITLEFYISYNCIPIRILYIIKSIQEVFVCSRKQRNGCIKLSQASINPCLGAGNGMAVVATMAVPYDLCRECACMRVWKGWSQSASPRLTFGIPGAVSLLAQLG